MSENGAIFSVYIIALSVPHLCCMNPFLIPLTPVAFHFPSVPSFLYFQLPVHLLFFIPVFVIISLCQAFHLSRCLFSLFSLWVLSHMMVTQGLFCLAQNFLIQSFWLRHTLSRSTLPAPVVHNATAIFKLYNLMLHLHSINIHGWLFLYKCMGESGFS